MKPRRPVRSMVASIVALIALDGHCTAAIAAAPTQAVRVVAIDYRGDEECPTVSDFLEKLSARTPGVTVAPDDAHVPKLTIRVHIRRAGAGAHGDLSFRYTDRNESLRVVDGDTCESVVDALSLMSAIALEPTPGREAAGAANQPAPTLPNEPSAGGDRSNSIDLRHGVHSVLGVAGGAAFGAAPVAMPDAEAFFELAWMREALVSPTVCVGFDYARSGAATVPGGFIKIVRSNATIDGCPVRWAEGPFDAMPCVLFEVGTLAASGLDVSPERSAVRPWLAVGAVGNLRYAPPAIPRLFFDLTVGARLPLVRDNFFFEPNPAITVFRPPLVSGFVGGGVGVTIF